jgi:hypothetical protein
MDRVADAVMLALFVALIFIVSRGFVKQVQERKNKRK